MYDMAACCETNSETDTEGTSTELVTGKHFRAGTYRLHYETGTYFRQQGTETRYPHVDVSSMSDLRFS